jgi:fibronectin-binding autotransporter adhesin
MTGWFSSLAACGTLLAATAAPASAAVTATGDVTPAAGNWTGSQYTIGVIGDASDGILGVDSGSAIQTRRATLGNQPGVTGTAVVSGVGSRWTAINALNYADPGLAVGSQGHGSLRVEAGGLIKTKNAEFALTTGATGDLTVAGAGSKWESTQWLRLGVAGDATLTAEDAALLDTQDAYIGYGQGATATATVTGAQTQWVNSSAFHVSYLGDGLLTVADGGSVTTRTLFASLDDLAGNGAITAKGAVLDAHLTFNAQNPSQIVLPFGEGGQLTATAGSGHLGAGYHGDGRLDIGPSAAVSSSGGGYLGYHPGANGIAVVAGPGAGWSLGTFFEIGYGGFGTLTVLNGGALTSQYAHLGYHAGSAGSVNLAGPNSTWTSTNTLTIGLLGEGTFTADQGASVTTKVVSLGEENGSKGLARVLGAGTTWSATTIRVGGSGRGELDVRGGAKLTSGNAYVGYAVGGDGVVTISGSGTQWNAATLHIGYESRGDLAVALGAKLVTNNAQIGSDYSEGTVRIRGAGSQWTNAGILELTRRSATAPLSVTDGAEVTTAELYATPSDLSGDGTITVTQGGIFDGSLVFNTAQSSLGKGQFGSGGTLNVNVAGAHFGIGYRGTGALTIANGATISGMAGFLGYEERSTGSAVVTGAGTRWNSVASLQVGRYGSGTLTVADGAQVQSLNGFVGYQQRSNGKATVTGANAKWTAWDLYVGYLGTGSLEITDGGQVSSNRDGIIGYSISNAIVTISGPDSSWKMAEDLLVGQFGTGATLNITSGGLAAVGKQITISSADSAIYLATGGTLALFGNSAGSLQDFLTAVQGTDAIRYWNAAIATWTPLTTAVSGVNYTLTYQATGDLAGYTLLTVGRIADADSNGVVDGNDFLALQRNPVLGSISDWKTRFGAQAASLPGAANVPEPAAVHLVAVAASAVALSQSRGPRRKRFV